MNNLTGDDLLLIPCCKGKAPDGQELPNYIDPLCDLVDSKIYDGLIKARQELLNLIRGQSRFVSGKYAKNAEIRDGWDFGGKDVSGLFRHALNRYTGHLYSADTDLANNIQETVADSTKPKLLILSAVYGPSHPLTPIQDYELLMSDSPAFRTWSEHFGAFLKCYVERQRVKSIFLYMGSATPYLKVAIKAIKPLTKIGQLKNVFQYEIIQGSSYVTPHNHGLLLLSHLSSSTEVKLTRDVRINSL
jgi:hypothetical protein